jgi:disulfide bond formation protein DsbB
MTGHPRALLAGMAAAALAAVGAALVSQHGFDMPPCPWCVLQRLLFVLVAGAALLGLAWRRVGAGLVLLLALAGVAAAVWQNRVAAASGSCKLTLADRIITTLGLDALAPAVFMPMASCADAAVSLAGLPYEAWSGALFLLLGAAAVLVLRQRP